MRYVIWISGIFLLLVLQIAVLVPLHLWPVNLILVFMAVALLLGGFQTALFICLAGGIMLDFVTGTTDGLITFSLLVLLITIYLLFETFFAHESNQLVLFATVAASTWLYGLFLLVFNELFNLLGQGWPLEWHNFLLNQFVWSLIFNLLLTYPVIKYFNLIDVWTRKMKKSQHG